LKVVIITTFVAVVPVYDCYFV